MQFQNLNGKQVGFHKAFSYLYQPIPMEHIPPYPFYSETKFINILKAHKDGIKYFEYTKNNLFHATKAVVYCKKMTVPMFPWNWLGLTKLFLTLFLHPTDTDIIDHQNNKNVHLFYAIVSFFPIQQRPGNG
jgi:hypothetical protein